MTRNLRSLIAAKSSATSVIQTLLVKVFLVVVSLATGIITARSFGPAGRGEQSAIGLWPWLTVGLATFGVVSALRYHTSRQLPRGPGFLAAACIIATAAGLCGACAAALFMPVLLGNRYSLPIIRDAQHVVFFAPVLLIFLVFRAYLEANGKFKSSNFNALISPLVGVAALLALRAFHALTPVTANLAIFVPVALQSLWIGFGLRTTLFVRHANLVHNILTLLSYGIKSYGSDILGILSLQADQAVIVAFLSPASLGLYTVALTASRTTNIIQESLNNVLFPKASGLEPAAAIELVRRIARVSTAVSGTIILILMMIVPIVLPIFYGARFGEAAKLTQILMLEAFFGGTASVCMQGFLASGRPALMTLIQGCWLASSITLLIFLVPRLGLPGAAISLVVSSLIRLALVLTAYPLALKAKVPRLVPTRADFAMIYGRLLGLVSQKT
jgi:O-antigen/teichoic acid export membrane protein